MTTVRDAVAAVRAMSDTPMTDACRDRMVSNMTQLVYVSADFARQLERDLTALTTERDRWQAMAEAAGPQIERLTRERDANLQEVEHYKRGMVAAASRGDGLRAEVETLKALLRECKSALDALVPGSLPLIKRIRAALGESVV